MNQDLNNKEEFKINENVKEEHKDYADKTIETVEKIINTKNETTNYTNEEVLKNKTDAVIAYIPFVSIYYIITSLVNVFRSEDKQYDAMTRLWNFRVREVVFIGDDKFVLDNLDDIMNEAKRYAESLGIKAEIEEASDNFYPTKCNNIKAKLQISNSLKKELITYIGEKKVALASFNFHGNHFSEPFDFSDGGRVVSGCAGFGLERWVSAIQSVRSEKE